MSTPFTVNIEYLRVIFDRLVQFVAKDDTRPCLTCIKLRLTKKGLEGVAADGFVLAYQRIDYATAPRPFVEAEALVQPAAVRSFLKTCGLRAGPVGLVFEERRLLVIVPPHQREAPLVASFPTIDASYPKYETLKPSEDLSAVISVSADILKKVALATKPGSHPDGYGILHLGLIGDTKPLIFSCGAGHPGDADYPDDFWALIMPMFTDRGMRLESLGRAMKLPGRRKSPRLAKAVPK